MCAATALACALERTAARDLDAQATPGYLRSARLAYSHVAVVSNPHAMAAEVAPNGLPYSRCPPADNEWAKRSRLLATLPADPSASMHPWIVARPSPTGGGCGLFVTNGIVKGEIVWAEPCQGDFAQAAHPRTRAWIEALPPDSKRAYCHFMYQTDEDEYQSLAEFNDLPVEDYPQVHTVDISNFMNHSADRPAGLSTAATSMRASWWPRATSVRATRSRSTTPRPRLAS